MLLNHEVVHVDGKFINSVYASSAIPKRLIVFVHGFLGKAESSWGEIMNFDEGDKFWNESDLIFIKYKTLQKTNSLLSLADEISQELRGYYPNQNPKIFKKGGYSLRPQSNYRYDELYLIGHSMGGVIVKQIVLDDAAKVKSLQQNRAIFSSANVRLFSPAHGGFRPSGKFWMLIMGNLFAPFVPYLHDLKINSTYLSNLNNQTGLLCQQYKHLPLGLQSYILWAQPEHIVVTAPMINDSKRGFVNGRDHMNICKPDPEYILPWKFISKGELK